jgi:hypothetical protein
MVLDTKNTNTIYPSDEIALISQSVNETKTIGNKFEFFNEKLLRKCFEDTIIDDFETYVKE